MNHIYLNLTLPIYHPLPLPCFYPRYLICLGLLKFSGVSPLIFFLHLLNFHLVALEENQQCIPKNKREKQCFKKRRYTMQLVTCLLRKYERVCKVKNHCKLEFSTCLFFFYSPSFLHTAHHTDDLYERESELRKNFNCCCVHQCAIMSAIRLITSWIRTHHFVESIEIVPPSSNISSQSLTIRDQK